MLPEKPRFEFYAGCLKWHHPQKPCCSRRCCNVSCGTRCRHLGQISSRDKVWKRTEKVKLTALRSCRCAGSWPGGTSTQTRRWKMPTKASAICSMAGSGTVGLTRWHSSPRAQAAAQFTDRLAGRQLQARNQRIQQVGDQWRPGRCSAQQRCPRA